MDLGPVVLDWHLNSPLPFTVLVSFEKTGEKPRFNPMKTH